MADEQNRDILDCLEDLVLNTKDLSDDYIQQVAKEAQEAITELRKRAANRTPTAAGSVAARPTSASVSDEAISNVVMTKIMDMEARLQALENQD